MKTKKFFVLALVVLLFASLPLAAQQSKPAATEKNAVASSRPRWRP